MSDEHSNSDIPATVERVKIWDPALRLFHWALVIAVVSAWGLGEFGPDIMTLHFYAGYAVCGLLAFRLIWGFVGPKTARFGHFIYGPKTVLTYLSGMFKREPSYWPGHNPVGAFAAFALLAILIAQAATGLMSDPDDFVNVGPLASTVGYDMATLSNRLHHLLSKAVMIIVVLHIAAIFFYKIWKRENLVTPMVTGWKLVKKSLKA